MEDINIMLTLKFGSKENIKDLFENGTIYCKPIEYFRKLEDEMLRGDSFEGTTKLKNFTTGKLTLTFPDGKELKLNTSKFQIKEHLTEVKGNLYCLTILRKEDFKNVVSFKFDERNKRFGSHFLLIRDNKSFYDRLFKGFEKQKLSTKKNLVTYYDKEKKDGDVSPFEKPLEFEYQKEFRIIIQNDEEQDIKFQIGSLEDISQVMEMSSLSTLECILD